jgi:hypothetical protein
MEEKNKGGRPLKFKSVEELQGKIDKYFKSCYKTIKATNDCEAYEVNVRPLTITGLAVALDCDRETLLNYEHKEEYFGTIRKAKLIIQNFAEESLWQPKIASGIMFNLKNNYGWVDKQEIVQDINANINTIAVAPPKFEE